MKKSKSFIVLMLLVLIMSLSLVACGQESEELVEDDGQEEVVESLEEKENSHYPVEIENYNFAGEKTSQTITEKPEKVIAVYQNSIETMLALGLEDNIVAASGLDHPVKEEFTEAFEKINYLEEFAPDKETVVMLEPDMILSWYSLFSDKNLGEVDYWNDKGIHTYMSQNSGAAEDRTLENEYTDILNIGKIFDVEEKAEKLVNEMKDEISKVEEHTKELGEKRRVLIIEKMGDTIRSYGLNSLAGDMLTSLNAEILSPEGNDLSKEDIVSLNPDLIFSVYMDRGDEEIREESVTSFTEDPSLKSVAAIENDEVYPIALGEMYSSGIRTIDGILTFARGLYPELYN